jgi:serine protease Do
LIQDVTRDLAESFDMDKPEGALVAKVLPESPAERAGIQVGDVIAEFNGRNVLSSSNLPPIVGSTPVGKRVPVVVMRSGKNVKLKVTLGELPDEGEQLASRAEEEAARTSRLGVAVVELTAEQRAELELEEAGVLVAGVEKGPAADAGLRKGDVILRINNRPVASVKAFEAVVKDLPAGKSVPVLLQRRGGPIFMALKVPEQE